MGIDLSNLGGWLDDGGHYQFAQGLPTYREIAPDALLDYEPSRDILLYMAWLAMGGFPNYPAQQIGDCVSFGHAHCNDLLECLETYFGEPTVPAETSTEFIYGASREVGNMLGYMDGSYGSAAVKAMTRMGIVSRKMLGGDGPYSGRRAKAWGRTGPPDSAKEIAGKYKLGAVAQIKTRADAISCLANGSPYTICSNQGFTTTRDENGFCRAQGRWGHCMFVAGWRKSPEGFLICNSWGNDSPSGPTDLDQPPFSFWCAPATMLRILNQDDSWGLFKSPDFVPRNLPSEVFAP